MYDGENQIYEDEANKFSADLVLSIDEEKKVISHKGLTVEDVIRYAEKFKTHPAIIIGRLQHLGLVPFGMCNHLSEPIEL